MAYSQSKVKSFRRCQKQYAFRHDYAPEGHELVPRVPKLALNIGSWLHELQAAHHRRWAGLKGKGTNWEKVQLQQERKFHAYFDEDREELGDLPAETRRLFTSYLRFWAGHDETRYRVASLHDGSPAVEFMVEVPLLRWGIEDPFKGRLDLLVEDLEYGGLWIWDAKWVRTIPDIDGRMMSPQALLYSWALMKMGYDIRGFVFNYGRKKAPTVPHVLKRPAGQLSVAAKMDTDYYTYLSAVRDQHGKHWKKFARTVYRQKLISLKHRDKLWFRRERIPVDKARMRQALIEFLVSVKQIERRPSPTKAPRTWLDYDCPRWCDYHDLCVAEFTGLSIEPLVKARYKLESARYSEEEVVLGT